MKNIGIIKSQNNKNKKPKEQAMKIVFVTSIVIVLLGAIGIFGLDNNSVLENTFLERNLEIPLSVKLDGNISTMET